PTRWRDTPLPNLLLSSPATAPPPTANRPTPRRRAGPDAAAGRVTGANLATFRRQPAYILMGTRQPRMAANRRRAASTLHEQVSWANFHPMSVLRSQAEGPRPAAGQVCPVPQLPGNLYGSCRRGGGGGRDRRLREADALPARAAPGQREGGRGEAPPAPAR